MSLTEDVIDALANLVGIETTAVLHGRSPEVESGWLMDGNPTGGNANHTPTGTADTNSPYRRPGTNNRPPALVVFSRKMPSATILANTSASRFG